MKFILFVICLSINLFALQITSFDNVVENGKTALLMFQKQQGIEYENVLFEKQKFPIVTSPLNPKISFALIPVSYYEKSGAKEVQINFKEANIDKTSLLFLDVNKGLYAQESIKVDSSKVNPQDPKVKKRIEREYNEAMKIYNTVTRKLYITKPFSLPLDSNITSDFGKARVYNGLLKGYHSGTDFRAKVGTPIVASNDGKVVLAAKRFYSGGTVVVDHGYGIYTCYFHMSRLDVKEGEMVKNGQVLGLSGQSGRVTGPHLHFAARVGGVQVDPLQLLSLVNEQILKETK